MRGRDGGPGIPLWIGANFSLSLPPSGDKFSACSVSRDPSRIPRSLRDEELALLFSASFLQRYGFCEGFEKTNFVHRRYRAMDITPLSSHLSLRLEKLNQEIRDRLEEVRRHIQELEAVERKTCPEKDRTSFQDLLAEAAGRKPA